MLYKLCARVFDPTLNLSPRGAPMPSPFCPCSRCRGSNLTLKQAIKICLDNAGIVRHGSVEAYRAVKDAERVRLEKLHKEKSDEMD